MKSAVSLVEANELLDRSAYVFGAEQLRTAWGDKLPLPATFPPIPFSKTDLRRAGDLEQFLFLMPPAVSMRSVHDWSDNKTVKDTPLLYNADWYEQEQFFTELPTTGAGWQWHLVGRGLIPGTTSDNYLQGTVVLARYLRTVFNGLEMPSVYSGAIEELEQSTARLGRLLFKDWQTAAQELVALQLNQLCRLNPAQLLFVLATYERVTGMRLLPDVYHWSNTCSSGGGVVGLGCFGDEGVGVDRDDPRSGYGHLGVLFSRSGELGA
jgi:hypothetical protein